MDLANADLYNTTDRYNMWRDFVNADAVIWSPPGESPGGFWSVFSHEACRRVLAPNGPFSSSYGMMIGFDRDHPDGAGGRMMVASDGARHTHLRKLIGLFLSRTKAASLASFVESQARSLIRDATEHSVVDVVDRIASHLPAAVVCEILGVPEGDRPHLIELTHHAFGDADESFNKMSGSEAHAEILFYFYDLIEERRRKPGEDVVSAMLLDEELEFEDVIFNCDNVVIGGNETTRHALASCFHVASLLPGLLHSIRESEVRLDPVVEEVIRWSSPAMHTLRVASDDFVVSGQSIRAGSPVVAWLSAANRDERVFKQPDRFIPDREPNKHLGFGNGPHHCLGAVLAKLEVSVLLRTLADSAWSVTLDAEPEWLRSVLVQGYRHLRVRIEWRD